MKQLINKYLRKFGVELHGTGYLQAQAKKEFKSDTFEVQKEICGHIKNPVIFDLGANNGDIAKLYLQHFSSARLYAFEPFPGSYNNLLVNFGNDSRVKHYQLAVSDSNEEKEFFVNKNVDTNSLLKSRKSGLSSDRQVKNITSIRVKTTTLNDFCDSNGINRIDILKMDIQGGELRALRGASKLLEQKKIGIIYLEVYFVEQYENHPLFHDISKYLLQFGFCLQDLYNPIYGKGSIAWADALFKQQNPL